MTDLFALIIAASLVFSAVTFLIGLQRRRLQARDEPGCDDAYGDRPVVPSELLISSFHDRGL